MVTQVVHRRSDRGQLHAFDKPSTQDPSSRDSFTLILRLENTAAPLRPIPTDDPAAGRPLAGDEIAVTARDRKSACFGRSGDGRPGGGDVD